MSEAPEVNFDAPVTKKKPAKKAAKKKAIKPAAPKDSRPSAPFPGMTKIACATSCNANGCAIGTPYCAHPCKGGLQGAHMSDPKMLARMQDARAQINVRLDPDRFK